MLLLYGKQVEYNTVCTVFVAVALRLDPLFSWMWRSSDSSCVHAALQTAVLSTTVFSICWRDRQTYQPVGLNCLSATNCRRLASTHMQLLPWQLSAWLHNLLLTASCFPASPGAAVWFTLQLASSRDCTMLCCHLSALASKGIQQGGSIKLGH